MQRNYPMQWCYACTTLSSYRDCSCLRFNSLPVNTGAQEGSLQSVEETGRGQGKGSALYFWPIFFELVSSYHLLMVVLITNVKHLN